MPISVPDHDLPEAVIGLIRRLESFQWLTEDAAVTGNYDTALLAMIMTPLVPGDRIAKTFLDELIVAHKDYLQQFENAIFPHKQQPELCSM